jgi:hypothetical protein
MIESFDWYANVVQGLTMCGWMVFLTFGFCCGINVVKEIYNYITKKKSEEDSE